MSDFPTQLLAPFAVLSPYSADAFGGSLLQNSASSTVVQNQAYYFPFRLEVEQTAVLMCIINGTVSNGNVDVGIYDSQFNYVISSGAQAQGTVSVLQEFDITDTPLRPGNYYMAFSSSSATATFFVASTTDETTLSQWPLYVQASAHPLPTTTATPVKPTATSPVYAAFMGVAFDTLI